MSPGEAAAAAPPALDHARHTKYWLRCLKTLLPAPYTRNDSNRMYLGFLILSALDTLGVLMTHTTPEERADYTRWIYRCQHPHGGFRMWPGTDLDDRATPSNARWDPANVPATYFALASLLILGDDLMNVKRGPALRWIRAMQRRDGSCGETRDDLGIHGGRDPRFAFCVAGVRYILRGDRPPGPVAINGEQIEDLDIDALVACIQAAEAHDGGIADEAWHEPHAGYTFCSLGALALLSRLNTTSLTTPDNAVSRAPLDPLAVTKWLVARQTDVINPASPWMDEEATAAEAPPPSHELPSTDEPSTSAMPFSTTACAGMSGRTGKIADTCYAFWAGASLHILGCGDLVHTAALRSYLLGSTQHPILGGFGKFPGDLPDVYHSYMGLAALSLTDGVGNPAQSSLLPLDAAMCVTRAVRARLPQLWTRWANG